MLVGTWALSCPLEKACNLWFATGEAGGAKIPTQGREHSQGPAFTLATLSLLREGEARRVQEAAGSHQAGNSSGLPRQGQGAEVEPGLELPSDALVSISRWVLLQGTTSECPADAQQPNSSKSSIAIQKLEQDLDGRRSPGSHANHTMPQGGKIHPRHVLSSPQACCSPPSSPSPSRNNLPPFSCLFCSMFETN